MTKPSHIIIETDGDWGHTRIIDGDTMQMIPDVSRVLVEIYVGLFVVASVYFHSPERTGTLDFLPEAPWRMVPCEVRPPR